MLLFNPFQTQDFEEIDSKKLSKTEMCKKHGIPNSTLLTFLKNREKIEKENAKSTGGRKHIRESVQSGVDEAIYRWFLAARQSFIPLNGPLMLEKVDMVGAKINCAFRFVQPNTKRLNGSFHFRHFSIRPYRFVSFHSLENERC